MRLAIGNSCAAIALDRDDGCGVEEMHTLPALSRELCEQCLCLLEVWRLKPLREPAVDFRQQAASCIALPLVLPQPTQADCRPRLQPFRLLAAGYSRA